MYAIFKLLKLDVTNIHVHYATLLTKIGSG